MRLPIEAVLPGLIATACNADSRSCAIAKLGYSLSEYVTIEDTLGWAERVEETEQTEKEQAHG